MSPSRGRLRGCCLHEVRTVAQMGWTGTSNGPLLELAAGDFEVLLTADQNLEHQQNIRALPLAVAVLGAASNRIESLRPLIRERLA